VISRITLPSDTVLGQTGDVNGDGYADVIVGAYRYDARQTNEGAVFVFLGNDNTNGRPVLAQQQRGDGSGLPVQPWGGISAANAFMVELTATHPEGRGRVKLQVEACPPAVPSGNASCTAQTGNTWVDVTASAVDVAWLRCSPPRATEALGIAGTLRALPYGGRRAEGGRCQAPGAPHAICLT
jgi:hypothetical protein